jgi:isopentenyldiphosphate isomerase
MTDKRFVEQLTYICKTADEINEEGLDYILTYNNKEFLKLTVSYIEILELAYKTLQDVRNQMEVTNESSN